MDELQSNHWTITSVSRTVFGIVILIPTSWILFRAATHPAKDMSPTANSVFLGFATLFWFMGIFATMRGGVTIDASQRTLVRWWGPGFAILKQRIDFSAIEKVFVGFGIRPGAAKPAYKRDLEYWVTIIVHHRPTVVRVVPSLPTALSCGRLIASQVGCPLETEPEIAS